MKTSALSVALVLSACAVPKIGVTPQVGNFSAKGEFGAVEANTAVHSSLESLGLDGSDTSFNPRVDFQWVGMHLSVSGLSSSFAGSGTTEGAIIVDGVEIPANTAVDSRMDVDNLTGAFTWDFFPGQMIELGLGLGLSAVAFDIRIDDIANNVTVSSEQKVPIPMLAGRFGVDWGWILLRTEVGYLKVNSADVDGEVIDADGALEVPIFGGEKRLQGRIVAGYRHYALDVAYDDSDSKVDADITLAGPYVGITFSF